MLDQPTALLIRIRCADDEGVLTIRGIYGVGLICCLTERVARQFVARERQQDAQPVDYRIEHVTYATILHEARQRQMVAYLMHDLLTGAVITASLPEQGADNLGNLIAA